MNVLMTNVQLFTNQAIQAAATGDWEAAKTANEAILEIEPANIGALNRLGYSLIQVGNVRLAKQTYEKVLTIERFNPIAIKYLQLLKSKITPQSVSMGNLGDFIEEPGKTRSIALQKLADPAVLQSIPTATQCGLVVKNHRVNVVSTATSTYLGCLPDDVAFRLQKMIASGNEYSVTVQSTSKKSCQVFLKETHHSDTSPFATSFPLNTQARGAHQEDVMLDEAPLDIRETGDEVETSDAEEADPME